MRLIVSNCVRGGDKDYYCLSSKYHKLGSIDFELVNFIDGYGYVEIVLTPGEIYHQYIKSIKIYQLIDTQRNIIFIIIIIQIK